MLYLIDASIYIFRAYFSLPEQLTDHDGHPVNAVYGYADFLCGLLERTDPAWIAAAFDASLTSSFRNQLYPPYKANRALPPEELEHQLGRCRELTGALGITTVISETWEADDLIGTLARQHRDAAGGVTVVSRDKDLAQLLREGDVFWDYAGDLRLGPAEVRERFGVAPEALVDLLALTGDPVDNIPGVSGIGTRSAAALIGRFGDLETLYANLDSIAESGVRGARRIRRLLEAQREQAFLSRRLAAIACDARLDLGLEALHWAGPDLERLDPLLEELGFGGRLARRCRALRPGDRKLDS